MLEYVKDREEELALLGFCLISARHNKELIAELESHEDVIKPNGEIHKGKQKIRLKLIRDLKKELKLMKEFYIKRRDEPGSWSSQRYSFKKEVDNGRRHLHEGKSSNTP